MTLSLSEQLRRYIRRCGLSQYRLAQESGVEPSSLSRFMRGEHGLSTASLDEIGKVLRLRLVCEGPRKELLRKQGRQR